MAWQGGSGRGNWCRHNRGKIGGAGKGGGGGGQGGRIILIKSNNPILAGGEKKIYIYIFINYFLRYNKILLNNYIIKDLNYL